MAQDREGNGPAFRSNPALCPACPNRSKDLLPQPAHTPKPIEPVPFADWPRWAKVISKLRAPKDAGVGDTAHREMGVLGKVIEGITWGKCVCEQRRARWNGEYRYG